MAVCSGLQLSWSKGRGIPHDVSVTLSGVWGLVTVTMLL